MKYPHLAARLFNTPLLVHPAKLDMIIAGLGPRLLGADAIENLAALAGTAPQMFSTRRGQRAERGYGITDGVAVISAMGALVHRTRIEADSTRLIGYNDVAADVEDAMANPDVHAIALVWDSPGGEVQGAFELADRLFALRGKKPMVSIADGMAASAAYLGSSAADELVITSTGYAGSIGVVTRHVDFSEALKTEGIKVTHIYAGGHKVDGNPYQPLPDPVRADMQAEIDGIYTQLIGYVAKQTGMDAEAIRNQQARVYRGVAAVTVGLATRIGTTDQVIAELAARRSRIYPAGASAQLPTGKQGNAMTANTQGGDTTPANQATQASAADLDKARAEGHAAGVKAERDRTSAILGHESAKGRTALALTCISTGLSVEQSTAILAAAPQVADAAAAAGKGDQFAQHMAALGNPPTMGTEAPPVDAAGPAAVAASWDVAFGIKPGHA